MLFRKIVEEPTVDHAHCGNEKEPSEKSSNMNNDVEETRNLRL